MGEPCWAVSQRRAGEQAPWGEQGGAALVSCDLGRGAREMILERG